MHNIERSTIKRSLEYYNDLYLTTDFDLKMYHHRVITKSNINCDWIFKKKNEGLLVLILHNQFYYKNEFQCNTINFF